MKSPFPENYPWNSRNTLTTVIAVHRMAKKGKVFLFYKSLILNKK